MADPRVTVENSMIRPIGENGARIVLPDRDEYLARILADVAWYEYRLLRIIRGRVAPGAVFVDIGAHLGNHTLFFALECGASRVVAYEAHPENCAMLRETVRLNGLKSSVEVVNAVVHPTWKTAQVEWADTDLHRQYPHIRTMLPSISEGGPVPCLPLQDVLTPDVDVVKIDAEEQGVTLVRDGIGAILNVRPLLIVEAGSEAAVGDALVGYSLVGKFCSTPTFVWETDSTG